MAKKKHKATATELALQWLAVIGAIITAPTVLPPVPWRMVQKPSAFGPRFTMPRYFSLFSATDQNGQHVSWMKLRKDTCYKMEQFNRPNPLTAIVTVVADSTAGTGGAVGGCQNWASCKTHVQARCTGYVTICVSGVLSIFMTLIGAICALCTPLLLSQEQTVKTKLKKEDARSNTMLCIIVAFALNLMAVSSWWFLTHSTFKGFQTSGFYPYPVAYVGLYVHSAGTFILLVAMYCGISRVYQPDGAEVPAEDETVPLPEDDDFVHTGPDASLHALDRAPPSGSTPWNDRPENEHARERQKWPKGW